MTVYSTIADSEIDPESPGTVTLFTKLRNNPLAIQEGDATAPKIVTAAFTAASIATSILTADDGIGQSHIAASAIGQPELKTATTEASSSFSAGGLRYEPVQVATEYVLGAAAKNDGGGTNVVTTVIEPVITDDIGPSVNWTPGVKYIFTFDVSSACTCYSRVRYITASPPYIGEDGLMHLFIYCRVNKKGVVTGVHISIDPPWKQPDYIKEGGKKVIASLDMSGSKPALFKRDMVMTDKFTSMNDTPIPYMRNVPNEKIVMLDPVCDVMAELLLLHEADQNVASLIYDGLLKIGNTPLKRFSPDGVDVVSVEWRK